ncbi:MAG: EamA family transporter [Prevotella sp.]|nr:EamA family transporter [Prevotella sp.]
MKSRHLKAHVAVLEANIIFGFGVPITKILLDEWVTPLGYMFTRCAGAAIIFWAISWFMPKERIPAHDLLIIMGGGLMGVVVSQTLTAWALVYTTPVYFSLIAMLTPVSTMILAALFIGERITPLKMGAVLIGIAGALLMVVTGWQSGSGKNDLLGIALAILSLLTWSEYLIITRSVSKKYSAVTQMKWIFLVSSVVLLPFAWPEMGEQRLYSQAWGWDGALEMLFIVIFATVSGYFAIPYAMQYLRATTVSIYTNLQPIVASFIAIAIGQDLFSWDKPVALLLVLLSAYLITQREEKMETQPNEGT